MRGCLTLPFRLLFLALLIAAGLLAWTYREELRRKIHSWTAEPEPAASSGWAVPETAGQVRRKVAMLSTRDSVNLTASELASHIQGEANRHVPGSLDSVQVRLGRDEIEVRGLVVTRGIEFGPVTPVLRDREWVEAAGRLAYRRQGLAEWQIERARLRGVPVPRAVVHRLLRQLSGLAAPGAAEIPLPPEIAGVRTGSGGLVLYGASRR